jgi:hypothetical protein
MPGLTFESFLGAIAIHTSAACLEFERSGSSLRQKGHATHLQRPAFIAKRLECAGLPALSRWKDARPVKNREQAPALQTLRDKSVAAHVQREIFRGMMNVQGGNMAKALPGRFRQMVKANVIPTNSQIHFAEEKP